MHKEALQTLQEMWGHVHYAQQKGLSEVWERRIRKHQFLCHLERQKKPNLTKHSFAQLSKKLEKLEKVIKKQGATDNDSDSE